MIALISLCMSARYSGLVPASSEIRSELVNAISLNLSFKPGFSLSKIAIKQVRTYDAAAGRMSTSVLGDVESGISSSLVCGNTQGSGPGGAVERQARRPVRACLALLLPLTIAACDVRPDAARTVLKERGFERVQTSAAPAFGRPCEMTETHARSFVAFDRDGRRVAGVVCALDEEGDGARVVGQLAPAPAWDAFGARR